MWISRGQRDDLLWRSASSGGRATFQLRKDIINLAQPGDLTAIAPEGYPLIARCLIECKFYKDLMIWQGLLKNVGWLFEFWERTVRDAATYGKEPVLIAKQNRTPTLAVVRRGVELFESVPVLTSISWDADIYLFEPATEYKTP